ncbi:hypothetical protein BwSF19_77330 [Bradyrhizobium ottawaense]|nr:hypothetical protein BwSF19_77330 [Bradyrhizobium ottawaense]
MGMAASGSSVGARRCRAARTAIQNAASVAALLITTEAMVAELPKKGGAGPAMPPGGGMGGMDF